MLLAAKEEMLSPSSDPCVFFPLAADPAELEARFGTTPQLSENSRPGFARKNLALHQGSVWTNSGTALGIEPLLRREGLRSRCTGKERDAESSLDNFGARYNSSSLGRFMSPDPANFGAVDEYPQTWNAYSYVTNNPLNATDPNGLDCIYAGTASDNPNPGGAGTVTVVRGDCINAGGKNDSGTFVDGTVDTDKPITSDAATGDLTFGLTNDKGAYGTGIATNFYDPQSPGSSGQLNPFAQGVFSQINKMPIMKGIGVVYGASVVIGLTGGAACYYLCPEAAATGALTGEAGTYGIESTNTLNQIIGGPQRELLKEFFETGKAPEGLSQRTLQIYKDIAQRAVAAGKDQLGVQAQRIQMISNALK